MWKFRQLRESAISFMAGRWLFETRRRNLWGWLESATLSLGLGLLLFVGATHVDSCLTSRSALLEFESLRVHAGQTIPKPQEKLSLGEVDTGLWSQQRVSAFLDSFRLRTDVPIAVLQIPKIRLEVPLFDGTDDITLNHAVGRIAGTARPGESGNIGIAGHRDGFFRGLKDLSMGDVIELKTASSTDIYVVDEIQIVSPSDVHVLQPRSVPTVTLVTCYPFYFIGSAPQRFIVTASRQQRPDTGI